MRMCASKVQRAAAKSVLVATREQEEPLALGEYLDRNLLGDLLAIDDLRPELLLLAGDSEHRVGELLVLVPRLS